VVVAGLNSTIAERHDLAPTDPFHDNPAFGHFGYCGDDQLRWFAQQLEDYQRKGWLRIGAVHHNWSADAANAQESLHDADRVTHLLGHHLNLLLHGHTHECKTAWMSPTVPVFATGSAALDRDSLPAEVPNQYQIVRIGPNRIHRWTRCFDPGGRRWVGDTRSSLDGNSWHPEEEVRLEDVHATFPDSPCALVDISPAEKARYLEYVNPGRDRAPLIVAHCVWSKYPRGVKPPGVTLQINLANQGITSADLLAVDSWVHQDPGRTLFLVDSPAVNCHALRVLDCYLDYVSGGSVSHVWSDENGRRIQRILVGETQYESDKHTTAQYEEKASRRVHIFGNFVDYLLLMRLPLAVVDDTAVSANAGIVWLVDGITTKATHAGVHLFGPQNLKALEQLNAGLLPAYFEAVFEVPRQREVVEDIADLKLVHFTELTRKVDLSVR
jgi:hypothetical protein